MRQFRLMLPWALFAALAPAQAQPPGEVRGSIVDARGGEALSNVVIQLVGGSYRATSDAAGHFRIPAVAPGDYVLNVSTVGYHLLKRPFHLDAGETEEFQVILSPDTLRQTDTIEVESGPFETARQDSPGTLVLAGTDAKNLAGVLVDDPLRSVQSLPGVSSNDDFEARFSVRGADYDRVGLYLDGILLHAPFHTVESRSASGSVTAFNGDMVEELELHEGAFPVRFGDRTAGALDVHSRDGSRTQASFHALGTTDFFGLVAEGPLGRSRRGSWLAGARKSYLQYILQTTSADPSVAFGLEDVQGRLAYDLTPHNTIQLSLIESYSDLDRSSAKAKLGVNSIMNAGSHFTFASLAWRYTPTEKLLLANHAAWMREKFDGVNPTNLPLNSGYYGEWVWDSNVTWMWNPRNPLDAGWSVRRLRDAGHSDQYQSAPFSLRLLDRYNGTATRAGGFVEQSWMIWAGRLHFTAGARWDHHPIDGIWAVSPQASVSLAPAPSTRLQLAWGQYVQYPEVSQLTSLMGGSNLLPMRATHAIAAVEQRLGERARIRAEFYEREDRDLLARPLYDPRILDGKIFVPPANPPLGNSQRGYARGFEIFVQRRSANRLTGWVSYAYGRTRLRDGIARAAFPTDFDQRHTVNVYAGYRLRPSVNLSVRWLYGSGFPIPGYLRKSNGLYYLSSERNQLRLDPYQRADFRINKAWTYDKWKLTLYGEVVNLTNRTNYRFDSFNSYNTKTGQASLTLGKMFPLLPSFGIVFER